MNNELQTDNTNTEKSDSAEVTTKEYSLEDAKNAALTLAGAASNTANLLDKFQKQTLPDFVTRSEKENDSGLSKSGEKLIREFNKIAIAFELETHQALADASSDKYKALAVDFCNRLIEEYNCTTPSEKALAEIITGSYIRYLTFSQKLNNALSSTSTTALLNTFIAVISKELDKASRSYISALQTLKQIKNPVIELNVKATTAFIAQNQQVNVDKTEVVVEEEINESK